MRDTPYPNWKALSTEVNQLDEAQLQRAINLAVVGPCRAVFIERLHMRYCKLRAARERALLVKKELILL